MRTINASAFRNRCLALLDEVAESGEALMILKRGKPVAQVVPPVAERPEYPQDTLKGTIRILDDLIAPTTSPDDWDAERGVLANQD